ncbi:hypothetical protein WL01_26525 [Burkholderia ubonensis]|nr:hypothetical protein WL01_26525 [Burkholderia ubonensis]KWB17099.1 hypothetical protein WL33_07175 [Burkholderia ubonensis]KWC23229.1 hypothetical protein WL50_00740 [Burkholderia ubonensis]
MRHAVFGFKTRLFFTGQRLPDQRFNRCQLRRFIGTHEGHRHAAGARAAGTADTVHIVLRHDRQINVDHQRQVVDIQPARSHVGGYQHLYFTRLEALQRTQARGLRFVAVNRVDRIARFIQHGRQVIHAFAGFDEH